MSLLGWRTSMGGGGAGGTHSLSRNRAELPEHRPPRKLDCKKKKAPAAGGVWTWRITAVESDTSLVELITVPRAKWQTHHRFNLPSLRDSITWKSVVSAYPSGTKNLDVESILDQSEIVASSSERAQGVRSGAGAGALAGQPAGSVGSSSARGCRCTRGAGAAAAKKSRDTA
ncbi:hypothetical protein EVAR_62395_1 [Eumeta japonica]|uniref:Uncharacterized protein n=1 Tax=Eumeta variegata TaxID=151549 RepID=A0A4C1Z9X0_EUMVA|nr:hypothetical protein EVAR_62395_1 [Eumeta japonica]